MERWNKKKSLLVSLERSSRRDGGEGIQEGKKSYLLTFFSPVHSFHPFYFILLHQLFFLFFFCKRRLLLLWRGKKNEKKIDSSSLEVISQVSNFFHRATFMPWFFFSSNHASTHLYTIHTLTHTHSHTHTHHITSHHYKTWLPCLVYYPTFFFLSLSQMDIYVM